VPDARRLSLGLLHLVPATRLKAHSPFGPRRDLYVIGLRQAGHRARHHPLLRFHRRLLQQSAVEAVWATLKRELQLIYGRKTWPRRDLLRSVLFDYIEAFYNSQRTQMRLGSRPTTNQLQWLNQMCALERVNTNPCRARRPAEVCHRGFAEMHPAGQAVRRQPFQRRQ
jgi:hypothetical protein